MPKKLFFVKYVAEGYVFMDDDDRLPEDFIQSADVEQQLVKGPRDLPKDIDLEQCVYHAFRGDMTLLEAAQASAKAIMRERDIQPGDAITAATGKVGVVVARRGEIVRYLSQDCLGAVRDRPDPEYLEVFREDVQDVRAYVRQGQHMTIDGVYGCIVDLLPYHARFVIKSVRSGTVDVPTDDTVVFYPYHIIAEALGWPTISST